MAVWNKDENERQVAEWLVTTVISTIGEDKDRELGEMEEDIIKLENPG